MGILGVRPGGRIAGRWRVTDDGPAGQKPRRVPVSPALLAKTLPPKSHVLIRILQYSAATPSSPFTPFTPSLDTTLERQPMNCKVTAFGLRVVPH